MMEENSKAKRKKPRKPLSDDKELAEFLEMVRGLRAYSKVRHDKHLTTGLMLRLQRILVNWPCTKDILAKSISSTSVR